MGSLVYKKVKEFKKKYPLTISWRLKAHSKIIEKHLNKGEEILYAFAAQKNDNPVDIITTNVIAITTKRIMIGQKRILFGYFFNSITPDLFNDIKVKMGIIWGKIYIDTVKEFVTLSNIQKEALTEIETAISDYIVTEKAKYDLDNK